MTDRTIEITTEDGKKYVCDILFTYHSDEFNKDYVLFVPRGENQVSAAQYVEQTGTNGGLIPIETDEEWSMLEELLNDYYQQDEEGGCGSCGSCGGCGGQECDGCDGNCGEE